jgi:uncharacterized repeat protein (TIGR03803 family)
VGALAPGDVVYTFQGPPDSGSPFAGLLAGTNGEFYGTTFAGGKTESGQAGTVFEVSSSGTESVLYYFTGGTDGAGPQAGLIAGKGGVLYGDTDYGGGGYSNCTYGCGTVFELTPSGSGYSERVIYAFQGGSDGANPLASLLIDKSGALYGTTVSGGRTTACVLTDGTAGCGTAFKLTPSGSSYTETVLHSFQGGNDGAVPTATLIADASGALYGTTNDGGGAGACTSASGTTGCGTAFKLTPAGSSYTERVLYSFKGGTNDGSRPWSALLAVKSLKSPLMLVGTTEQGGGSGCGGPGCGTVFAVSTSGSERVLHSFGVVPGDGRLPYNMNGLYTDTSGALYGTTYLGDTARAGCGTAFKLTPSGSGYTESVLYSFKGARRSDGCRPFGSLTADAAGTLYGTTSSGGTRKNYGIVFKVSP